jgi:hypothetical protein
MEGQGGEAQGVADPKNLPKLGLDLWGLSFEDKLKKTDILKLNWKHHFLESVNGTGRQHLRKVQKALFCRVSHFSRTWRRRQPFFCSDWSFLFRKVWHTISNPIEPIKVFYFWRSFSNFIVFWLIDFVTTKCLPKQSIGLHFGKIFHKLIRCPEYMTGSKCAQFCNPNSEWDLKFSFRQNKLPLEKRIPRQKLSRLEIEKNVRHLFIGRKQRYINTVKQ